MSETKEDYPSIFAPFSWRAILWLELTVIYSFHRGEEGLAFAECQISETVLGKEVTIMSKDYTRQG